MNGRGTAPRTDTYSPQRRTALLLTGTGTGGAYHAGVLRALQEAGVKIDVVAGRGVGVIGALFAAVDGAQRLWDGKGLWHSDAVRALYPWRPALRLLALSVALAVALVVLPLAVMAVGLLVYPIDFVLAMVGLSNGGLVAWYVGVATTAFAPAALPTWLPRLAVLVLGAAALTAFAVALRDASRRRARGGPWWRVFRAPLTAEPAIARTWSALWDLVRGAAHVRLPSRVELARRYTELLADNLGQPGFRELLLVAHDVDAGRDLLFAMVAEARRRDLVRRPLTADAEARRAEVFDLAGVSRDHLADALAAALSIPLATDLHEVHFAPDAYWRGETHRLCDRPGSVERLLQELGDIGVEQILLVAATPHVPGPHTLSSTRLDGRGRIGEYLRSSESSALRDAVARRRADDPVVFVLRPTHNSVGPLDFKGGFDDGSARTQTIAELMARGYEDAYHEFIEPVVGASGEVVGR
jgi:hypothetical protein